ncbi:uncharacterized protein BP5553_00173 [Venustampulla echinocandica]|uniref:Uncharacterized protein n=1 Tax=Venustampulla echinocandica TaxID=2656787 RepID=A0A370TXD4_9HELO|nr:uncharacterized protein BP5553_00173 [Venustampulla echinocandica]RDL40194.1 hypothetical protein BP5553_00173 [Venustampulla echinocandica]
MLKSTILSILALTVPMASAVEALEKPMTPAMEKAFKFGITSDNIKCHTIEIDTWIPDGKCLGLPGKLLNPGKITSTCRVFAYMGRDCTGNEIQIVTNVNGWCYKIDNYYSIKAFCAEVPDILFDQCLDIFKKDITWSSNPNILKIDPRGAAACRICVLLSSKFCSSETSQPLDIEYFLVDRYGYFIRVHDIMFRPAGSKAFMGDTVRLALQKMNPTDDDGDLPHMIHFKSNISSFTNSSLTPSPTKSVRSRRVQLDYTKPAMFFGPLGQSYGSEEEMSDNGDSESRSAEQTAPTIHQQVRKLSLEHADVTSSAVIHARIPPTVSSSIRRLLGEAADPVLPRDIISRISFASPTEYFPCLPITAALLSLSASSDPVAAKTFTCPIIEVKAPGGNFQETSYQVAIASAAMLQRLRLLDKDADDGGDYMPVRVLGPCPSGNTATYLGLDRLLRIVEEVKLWGKETSAD